MRVRGWNVTYDEIGNPTHIGGITEDPDSIAWGKELEWEGRLLTKIGEYPDYGQLDYEISYTYNADGIRTSKTYLGITHSYELNGTRILSERIYDSSLGDDVTLQYIYDESGAPIGLRYRDNTTYGVDEFDYFWYEKNLQGDVIAIYTEAGVKIGTYDYDAWGNCTAKGNSFSSLSVEYQILHYYNSFRYRGYYYDNETGFYYVSSRYYDPEIGRWINADSVIADVGGSIQGYNMFAYCFNNPVNMSDSSGHWPQWMKNAANWVNNNIIQPVANFFSPSTNTISGQFQDGIFRGSGSLTGGYSEFNWRLDDKIKSSRSQDVWVGGFGKASVGNANGKIGIGNDNLSASLKGVGDGLVATAQAGLHYKDGFGVGAKAKASVLSGRATIEFNIFGWQVELGVSGELLSIGAEATIGIFPTESGGKEFRMKTNVSPGPYGWGYVVRIKSPY